MKNINKITFITREDVTNERPFGRPAQMIKRFEKNGYSIKKIHDISKRSFLKKLSKIKEGDILVTCGSKPVFLGILGRIRGKTPKIIHDWMDDYSFIQRYKGSLNGRIFYPIYKNLENQIMKFSDKVIVISKSLQIRGREIGIDPIYIPCGVNKELFDEGNGRKIREKYKDPIVLYVGGGGKFKNLDILVKSVKNLNCHLILLGFGYSKETTMLSEKMENVTILGRKPQKEIPNYIDAATICCSPSDWDGSLKTLEYIYMKKAILGVKGKLENILTDGKDAFLTDISIEGFRRSIEILLEDKDLRKNLERNAGKIRVWDWDDVFEVYKDTVINL